MTLRRTGPGQVITDSRVPAGGVRAILSNFDFDGDAVKPEHTRFLDTEVIPRLVNRNAHIWLQGSASHAGSDAYNMGLSRRRVNNIVAYLRSRGVLDSQMQPDAVGESMALPGVEDADRDRAVGLLMIPVSSLTIPPPRTPPPPPPTSTVFRIRMLGGLSAGAVGVQADLLYFQIWDQVHRLSCIYQYTAGGMGRSVRLPLSVTLQGPWNDMRTNQPLQVTDFAGAARFTSAGGGPFTWNYLNMMGLPPGASTVPGSMPISTGFTVGIGAGTTVGIMIPADTTPWPYSGP